jgi:hypothetical protein
MVEADAVAEADPDEADGLGSVEADPPGVSARQLTSAGKSSPIRAMRAHLTPVDMDR